MQKGDIYNYYNKGKQKYTALQIVDIDSENDEYLLLALYYWDDTPLTKEDIANIKPFFQNHHSWKGEYNFMLCKGEIPDCYSFAGNREVLHYPDKKHTEVESWIYDCLQISLQKAWDDLPQSFKDNYKRLKGAGSNLSSELMKKITDKEALDTTYPALTTIHIDGTNIWLTDYLNTHHNVTKLVWKNTGEKLIDLSANRIRTFRTDGKGIDEIILNDYINDLTFLEPIEKDIIIKPTTKNCSFALDVRNTNYLYLFQKLNITELCINGDGKTKVNIAEIVQNLPYLKTLRIWGKPDHISNMKKISSLKNLEWITLKDVFGFSENDFPTRKDFPNITCIWMDSIPDDVAKKVKKEYKEIDLWITKGRKPEWLEVNLKNPFRHWDGDNYISQVHAKKATNLYIKLSKQIYKLIKEELSLQELQSEIENIVIEYTKEFNKMDKRTHWIDTVIREDISNILTELLKPIKEVYNDKIDFNRFDDLFEELIDF